MHAKLLEEWLAGIQHCYLLLLLLIVTFIEHLLCNNYTALKILHAFANLKIVVVLKYIHKVFDISLFEKWKLIPSPLSVGWTQLPAPKEQNVAEGEVCHFWDRDEKRHSLVFVSWITRSGGSQLACQEERSTQGLWPQSSLQVTVALVSTSTTAWWSRTTQLRYSWFPDPQTLCVIINICCFNLLRLGKL